MPLLRRAVKLVAATFGFLLYVWYAAVRATPDVKRRKARAEKGAALADGAELTKPLRFPQRRAGSLAGMRRLALIVTLAAVAACASCPPASASRNVQYGIQDDAWLADGPGTLDHRLDVVQKLGVSIVRYSIHWDQVAPTKPARALASNDPAYRWQTADTVLNGLHERGIEPLVTLYGAPAWANGGRKANAPPKSSRTFADFAYAAAKRYPFVRKWTIWNEPNQNLYLAGTSPSLYVKTLLNPGYAAIHRANRRALVAGGVTAPRGNSGGYGPLAWVRGLAAAHAKLDAYAHNPYPTRPRETPLLGACGYCDVISMANLGRLSRQVQHYLGHKPIWLTEYGYQTNPPDRLRRRAEPAGDVRRRGGDARVPALRRVAADPVPAQGRAAARPLPDGPLHGARDAEAGVLRVPLPARAGQAQRHAHGAVGADPSRKGLAHVPDGGLERRQVALGRAEPAHELASAPSRSRSTRRRDRSCASWSPADRSFGWPILIR